MTKKKKIIKVYTRTGDKGESGLADGSRLPKSDPLFELLGGLDQVNVTIGFCVSGLRVLREKIQKNNYERMTNELLTIQDKLLTIGAVVAGANKVGLMSGDIEWLERKIDYYQMQMADDWTTQFLLPGGTELAARIDGARVDSRKAERVYFRVESRSLDGWVLIGEYLNRLSDYLFVLRCFVNSIEGYREVKFKGGYAKVLGIAGKTRKKP